MKRICSALAVILFVSVLALPSLGQSDRAGMVGTITDPNGAAVPGAKVTVTSVETGYAFDTTADDQGRYTTPVIFKPGSYKVTAEAKGFKTATSDAIVLQIGDVREVNLKLQIGEVNQTVTVTAEAPLLQTETSDRGEVITGKQITDLPLKDRNFTQLATLTPGVSRVFLGVLTDATAINQGDTQFGEGNVSGSSNNQGSTEASRFSRSAGASITVNGLRPTNNNYTLDGVDNNEPQFATIGVFPNPDAIQEFKVDASVAKAEVGRGGVNINAAYQAGTNQLHGELYYYGQNAALNADPWEINRLRSLEVPPSGTKTPAQAIADLPKPGLRVNEFGFTVGGPIIKNKTFFFGDFLGQRNATPNAFSTAVPTANSRVGNFSEWVTSPRALPPTGNCTTNAFGMVCPTDVFDPLTCMTPGDITSGNCMTFIEETGQNIIPNLQSRTDFSAPAFKLLALYPLPTVTGITNPSQGNKNFFGVRNNTEKINSFDAKLDHRFSSSNTISGRYTRDNQERDRANFFPKVPTAGFGAGNEVGNTRQVAIDDAHIFKPSLLNDLKFGWTHVEIGILNCGVEGACGISPTICMDLGIPNCNHGTPASTGGILTGGFGTGEFEFTGDGGLFSVNSDNFYVSDAVSIISGRHSWKTGVEVRPIYLDTIDGGRSGGLKGHIQYCNGFGCGPQGTGNIQADYLLQRPAHFATQGAVSAIGVSQPDLPFNLHTTQWSFYVQDDWKTTSRLALNLGARYDVFPSYTEAHGRLANYNPFTGVLSVAPGSGSSLVNTAHGNVGPRVGFAYSLNPKIVLRGAYGMFYALDGFDYPPVIRNPPLTNSVAFTDAATFPGGVPMNDFNLTAGPPVPPAGTTTITTNTNLFTQQPNQKLGQIQEFNLTGQWEFANNWLVDVGYVSTLAHHLLGTRDYGNQGGNGNGLGLAKTLGGLPIGSDIAYENRYNSNYNSLQLTLEKRYSQGLLFRSTYTYSHNIDDTSGVFNALGEGRGTNGGPVDPFNLGLERGNSSLDTRHLFTAIVVWDLPFGSGRRFGGSSSGLERKLIGGWQFNAIWTGASGQPFTVVGNSTWGGRVNVTCSDPRAGAAPGQYLNSACFTPLTPTTTPCPAPSTASAITGAVAPAGFVRSLDGVVDCLGNVGSPILFGNSARNAFYGPGLFKTDFSLFKNTTFGERYRVQIGIELFNAFNQTFNLVPNNNINNQTNSPTSSGSFGFFDNALSPRTAQYRLKVFF